MENLKKDIETLARLKDKTELEIIGELQAAVATAGDSELLDQLCALKWDYIKSAAVDGNALISGDGWTVANV